MGLEGFLKKDVKQACYRGHRMEFVIRAFFRVAESSLGTRMERKRRPELLVNWCASTPSLQCQLGSGMMTTTDSTVLHTLTNFQVRSPFKSVNLCR